MLTPEELEELRRRLEKSLNIRLRKKRIRALTVYPTHQQIPNMKIEVGKSYRNLEPGEPPDQVLAIFESVSFLVCTRKRGIEEGLPYFFAREDARKVEEME